MNKDIIIYNLILMLNEEIGNHDIDHPHFIDYICDGAYLPEAEYRRIMGLDTKEEE